MNISDQQYKTLYEKKTKNSPMLKNIIIAAVVGGLICCIGQAITDLCKSMGLEKELVSNITPSTMIFLGILFTGIGVYDRLAKYAGAGTLVPITGFANAVSSAAIEFKAEGFIFGVGAKMFTIAGPVIVYGVSASVVYGLIYWITTLF
ncbi:MAG: stage V sporulation protein AC [Ruminococcaceae bacterium]|nr:stage V sporulation protein AC [Oscillospiraceae bacterium]